MTPADPPAAARNPLTDPQEGDIVEIQPNLFRHVSARTPRIVWFHSRYAGEWLLPTYQVSIGVWQKEADGGKVIEIGKEVAI